MSCAPPLRTTTVAVQKTVYSNGNGSPNTESFVPITGASMEQIAPLLKGVRATLKVEAATENYRGEVGFQLSNNGVEWGDTTSPTNGQYSKLGSPISGDGEATTAWYSTEAAFTRAIRFGVISDNTTGTNNELATVTVTLDLELRS